MAFKRLLILGGAALLTAGCGADITSPTAEVSGTAAVRNASAPKKSGSGTGMTMSMQASDSTSCQALWPVSSGAVDTTCASEP